MVNTDEEMKEINEMIGSLTDPGPENQRVQIHNLLNGEFSEMEVHSTKLHGVVLDALKNNGILHLKKSCSNPGNCMNGDEPWHSAMLIADGEVFLSWETTKAIRNAAVSQIFNDLFGGLFDKQ